MGERARDAAAADEPTTRETARAPALTQVAVALALQRSVGNRTAARVLSRQRHRRHGPAGQPQAPPALATGASSWHPPPETFHDPPDNPQPMWGNRPGDVHYGYGMSAPRTPEEQRLAAFQAEQLQSSWTSGRPPSREELQTIVNAVNTVCRGNPDLLARYLDYYSGHRIRVSTSQLNSAGTVHGAETTGGGETALASNWRSGLSLGGIGAMLLHEFVHTGGPGQADNQTYDAFEGYAYATDLFLAERAGASERVQIVLSAYRSPDGQSGFSTLPAFVANFRKAYGTLVLLYDVIDHGRSAVPDDGDAHSVRHRLHAMSPSEARGLAADFIAAPNRAVAGTLGDIVQLAYTDPALVRAVFPQTAYYRERSAGQPR